MKLLYCRKKLVCIQENVRNVSKTVAFLEQSQNNRYTNRTITFIFVKLCNSVKPQITQLRTTHTIQLVCHNEIQNCKTFFVRNRLQFFHQLISMILSSLLPIPIFFRPIDMFID